MAKLYKYTFSDGSWCVAETIEKACVIQKSQGFSSRVVKREEWETI